MSTGADDDRCACPIVGKLAACIRMLSSDKDGDVITAACGLVRMLKGAGTDIHAFAERIAKPNGGLTEAEMRKLYDAGYEAGVRAVENKQHGPGDFHNDQPSVSSSTT